MKFKEITRRKALRRNGRGEIEYSLEVTEAGAFYVQIHENTDSETHAQGVFFPVTSLVHMKNGTPSFTLDAVDGQGQSIPASIAVRDTKVLAFLEAIANDLLP